MNNNKNNNNSDFAALVELLGDKIVPGSGGEPSGRESTVSLSSFIGSKEKTKQIILYISASWCPPCQGFTPILSAAYEGYKKKQGGGDSNGTAETQLIFVSRDGDEESFLEYHKKMSFPALVYDKDRSEKIMTKFGVEGIPSLVAIDWNGEAIQKDVDFRSLIATHFADAFPLTPERILQLEIEQKAKSKEALKSFYTGDILFEVAKKSASSDDDGTAVSKLTLKELLVENTHVAILLGDGDVADGCYETLTSTIGKVNSTTSNDIATAYVGWSLYNEETCDHSKLAPKFDYYVIEEVSKEIHFREAIETICGGNKEARAPQLILLRKGTGLCSLDGKCEDEDTPVVVSTDPGLMKIRKAGDSSFPWDKAAMTALEDAEKAEVEALKSKLKDMQFLTNETEETGPLVAQGCSKNNDERSLKERLFVGKEGPGAVVGLYFSASWCGPCVRTTPKLVNIYEEVKSAGKKFEIVFVSSDSTKAEFEEYYKKMVTKSGDQFLALDYGQRQLKNRLSTLFEVRGIPTLVLLKPDGTTITKNGVNGINIGGAEAFPWDDATIEKIQIEREAEALRAEKEEVEAQVASGVSVVRRLIGNPRHVKHNVSSKTLSFNAFSTVGVPDLYADSGVIYYELEILKEGGLPQFGFSLKDGLEFSDKSSKDGVGDAVTSWSVDGVRECKWNGKPTPHPCSWAAGNIIGLAVNVDKGMFAVSKDGDWKKDGFGVVFEDENIKHGVYPCFTASEYEVKYSFAQNDFKHGPPDSSVWDVSE